MKKKNFNLLLNIIIIALIFILVCVVASFAIPKDLSKYISTIKTLESQVTQLNETISNNETKINQLNEQLSDTEKQISDLTNTNNSLSSENQKLSENNTTLENEKQNLNNKISELQNTISAVSVSSQSTSSPTPTNSTQGYTVYITDTGKKYHKSSCSYLNQSKTAININSAKSQGYTPCSRCKP